MLVREDSHLARRPLADLELPVQTGMRVVAIRRGRDWITDVDGDELCTPGDVLFLRGSPAGIDRLRELAAAPRWEPPVPPEDGALTDLDRAVDVLVEMKNISEAAVGLAYSALVLARPGPGRRGPPPRGPPRRDEGPPRAVGAAGRGADDLDPSPLRGLLHLSQAAEDIGDQAQQMVWLIEQKEELHPILAIALGESDEVVVRVPVGAGQPGRRRHARRSCGSTSSPASTCWPSAAAAATSTGPGGDVALQAGDELIASGPDEGHPLLAELLRLAPRRGRGDRRAGARPPDAPSRRQRRSTARQCEGSDVAAEPDGGGDALDADGEGRLAQRAALVLGERRGRVVGPRPCRPAAPR